MKKKNRRNDCFPLQDDSRKPNEEMIKGEKIGIKKRLKKISDLFVQCTHITSSYLSAYSRNKVNVLIVRLMNQPA